MGRAIIRDFRIVRIEGARKLAMKGIAVSDGGGREEAERCAGEPSQREVGVVASVRDLRL